MTTHTTPPWRCLPDTSLWNEPHYQVVDQIGAPIFDSLNRSPLADEATEHADMQLAAAAPALHAALLVAREFISAERNNFADCCTYGDRPIDANDQAELDDMDALLLLINTAMVSTEVTEAVPA